MALGILFIQINLQILIPGICFVVIGTAFFFVFRGCFAIIAVEGLFASLRNKISIIDTEYPCKASFLYNKSNAFVPALNQ